MAERPEHPMAAAMQWVSRVFAASLMMVLPGVGGLWLDDRWGTSILGFVGFALGLVGGVVYLIGVTRQADASRRKKSSQSTAKTNAAPGGEDRERRAADE